MQNKFEFQFYHWHFEISGKCTLQCPRCPRIEANPVPWINKELSLSFFKNLLPPDFLKTEVKRITLCGDIGDPIYASEFLEIIEYLKITKPDLHIFIITNGSYRKVSWWEKLATLLNVYDTVNFSVDGYDHDTNNLYRVNSNFSSIISGMSILCKQSECHVNWATIVFSFNQDNLSDIKNLAKEIGCDGFQLTYSTKFGKKYKNYGAEDDRLQPRDEFISKTHRYERYFEKLSDRDLKNTEYLEHNKNQYIKIKTQYNKFIRPMCSIGNRGLYVSADGVLHPCSWVSFPYVSLATDRKTIKFENSFNQLYRDKLNLHQRSLVEIINDSIWEKLYTSFNDRDRAWVECEQKCHVDLVNEDYSIGWYTN